MKTAQVILFFALSTAFQIIPWDATIFTHIHFYIPLLTLFCLMFSFPVAIFAATTLGLVMDLLTSTPFGIFAITYFLSMLILFRFRRFFTKEPISYSLFAMLFSVSTILLETLAIYIMKEGFSLFSLLKATLISLLIVPILDGIFSLFFYALPMKYSSIIYLRIWRIYRRRKKRIKNL